jgi:hypothetical protein
MREQRSRRSAGNVHWAWAKAYVITLAHKLITVEVFGSALKRRFTVSNHLGASYGFGQPTRQSKCLEASIDGIHDRTG